MLSERKKRILTAVVDGYIETASPISSKDIQQRYLPDTSSATIRNELSALESMGYLVQPHVSAGRVPSQKAFRLYVDELMTDDPLSEQDVEIINTYFSRRIDSIEDVVVRVAEVISDITNYTSIVVKEDLSDCIISIKLVDLSNGKILVVIVTDSRVLKDGMIEINSNFTPSMIVSAENWLNKIFVGKHVSEFINYQFPLALVNSEFDQLNALFKKIIDVLRQVAIANGLEVSTYGTQKIYEHSEYNDAIYAKQFLDTLAQKDKLGKLLLDNEDTDGVTIKIDQDDSMPQGCSAVTAKVNLGNKIMGNIGVIGPVRMNYKKVVSVLDRISSILNDIIEGK